MIAKCEECDADIAIPEDAIVGEIVQCKECSAEYEVASISNGKVFVSSYQAGTRTLYAIAATANPPTILWQVSGPGSTTTSFAQTPSAVIGANGTATPTQDLPVPSAPV